MSGNSRVTFVTGRSPTVSAHRTSKLSRRTSGAMVTFAMLAVIGPGLRAQAPSNEYLVSEGRVGSVEVGMSVDEILQAFGKERVRLVDVNKEGRFTPAIEIDMPGSGVRPALVAEITQGPCGGFSLRGITVRDPRFRTVDGLGPGPCLQTGPGHEKPRDSRPDPYQPVVQGNDQVGTREDVVGRGRARASGSHRMTLIIERYK